MNDPYLIDQPFIVSFSGGRTSAYMLRQILDAHNGLPSGSVVAFANTGREHIATLDFVEACATNWNIPIVWLERSFHDSCGFKVVNRECASVDGEPFAELIRKKKYLPNVIARFCTEELKVKTIALYCKSIGITEATMAVGLRADEPRRVHRVNGDVRQGFVYECPMARAGHTIKEVTDFWAKQKFDLHLPNNDRAFGNCDLCFLKSRSMLERVMRKEPHRAQWWIDQEDAIKGTFRSDRPKYAHMLVQVRIQPELFSDDDGETIPCTCTD